ncbi:MAG: DUF202 domain-containing protein [Ilumatobacteraceae bacterium]
MTEAETNDRGLQAERTILAWWRTALAVAVAGLLTLREALEPAGGAGFAVLAAAITAVLLGAVVVRIAELQQAGSRPAAPTRRPMAVFAAAALALQLLALILVLR